MDSKIASMLSDNSGWSKMLVMMGICTVAGTYLTCSHGRGSHVTNSRKLTLKVKTQHRVALSDILDAFKIQDNSVRMAEARDTAGNDMMKMMQIVFPIATQVQMDVIQKYGFPPDGDGMIRFAQTIKLFEKQNEEVAELNSELRQIVMPQMAAPTPHSSAS